MSEKNKAVMAIIVGVVFLFAGVILEFGEKYFILMWLAGTITGMGTVKIHQK